MIARLSGTLVSAKAGSCVVDVGGLGYEVRVGEAGLPAPGSRIILHTYLHQRDEGPSLYGFLTQQEKDCFLALLGVHGVGPKLAQGAVLALGPAGLSAAVAQRDRAALSKVPGLGKKRAETLIQELQDHWGRAGTAAEGPAAGDEAAEGLRGLGYSEEEIREALEGAGKGSTEERLKRAILKLGGGR